MKKLLVTLIIFALPIMAAADEIAVTVYNSNLGVVSETRSLDFDKGIGELAFRDVPSMIDPASVRFGLADDGQGVTILEQNYGYDLVSSDKLYAKYIDKQVDLVDKDGNLFSGILLAYGGNSVTLKDKSGKIKIVSLEHVIETNFPDLPEGLITRPTLFWKYNSTLDGGRDAEVSYQTGGMSWEAEYVGLLNDTETKLDLSGWASINNSSGKTYKDASLKLIAGDINRAQQPRGAAVDRFSAKGVSLAETFEEKAFFEYHMYTLPRKTTVADKQIKQVSLFEPASSGVEKIYLYRPDYNAEDVTVQVEFINSEKGGLGMPLPAGRVRIFKADTDGSMILLGEDRIGHTPRDEKVKLTIGTAFDVKAEQKTKNVTRISNKVEEREFEIVLKNRKDSDVTVRVEKNLYGYWEIIQSSFEYKKEQANQVSFAIPVKAGAEVTLSLTVRFTSR